MARKNENSAAARRSSPQCETSVPASNGRLMPNLTDVDATFEQAVPHSLDIRHHEKDVAHRADRRVGESGADLDRAARARRSELHDAKRLRRRVVDVEPEADLIDIKPQRSLDIAHR